MKYISMFSGVEAATVAFHPLGWTPICFAEIEAAPSAVLAHHYPETPNVGDMTAHDWDQYRKRCDLVVGGPPCQAFSVAGLRKSLDDDRGNLSLSYMRAIHAIDPYWSITENVPGWLSTKDNAFGCFLAGLVGEDAELLPPGGRWTDAGVASGPERTAAWRILDAQYFGVAQRRRRVFVLSVRGSGNWHCAAALFPIIESLSGNPPPRRETGQGIAHDVAPSIGASGRGFERAGETRGQDPVIAVNLRGREGGAMPETDDLASLRAASGGSSRSFVAFGDNDTRGPIDIATAVNAHGGPVGRLDFESETFVCAPPLTSNPYGDHESREGLLVTHTLRAEGFDASEDGTGRGTPLVPVAFDPTAGRDMRAYQDGTVPGLKVGTGLDIGWSPAVAFNVTPSNSNNDYNARETERAQAVTCGGNRPSARGGDMIVRSGVRRLTPRECERLQGFPDDYTLIPYRGKQMADGPRYKMLGNSFAVPVIRWIGERIEMVNRLALEADHAA